MIFSPRLPLIVSLICLLLVPLQAADLPPGGERLVKPDNTAPAHISVRHSNGKFGAHRVQTVDHAEFAESLLLTVTVQPPNTWDAGLSIRTTSAVKKKDLLLVGFWARGKSEAGGGVAELAFETAGAPYTKSVQYLVETPASGDWQRYWVRFRSLEDYAAQGALINFQAGYSPCTFEIGGLEAWNFGADTEPDALPHTPLTYVGREVDAPWRIAAQRRIDTHRKAQLAVTVVDAAGQPRAGVPVQLRMDRLAFDMGSAVRAKTLTEDSSNAERYRETFKTYFNLAVLENGLKWKHWEDFPTNRQRSLAALQWLRKQEIPLRGHVLVWPGYGYLPPWVKTVEKPEILRRVVDGHIRELIYAAGPVRDWDVLNELYANRDLTNILGKEEIVHWFKVAREVAPDAKRYYNDYAALVRGGFSTGHKDHFEETLRYLIANKAPIDGVGIQGHFGSLLTSPERLYSEMNRWATFGKPILITEFDVTVPGDRLRADFTRDFLTVCFSHPKVNGVVSWGFWSEQQWRPESAFFDADWRPTAMGAEWIKLVESWRTDASLTTDANGQIALSAFLGDYTITVDDRPLKHSHRERKGSEFRVLVSR